MLLHTGASLHGHEYSPPRPSPEPKQRPLPFLRTTLKPVSNTDPRRFSLPSTSSTQSWVNSPLPGSPLVSSPSSFKSSPSPPPPPPPHLYRRNTSDFHRKKEASVRFRDPPMEFDPMPASAPVSEDEDSLAGSEMSDHGGTLHRQRRRRRSPRTSTRFALAHPAPRLRNKQRRLVQLRPRVLLQLQQLGDKRPTPAFDVMPSSLLAGSIIIPILAKKFPRVFRKKPELSQNDVLIVRSEDYAPPSPGGSLGDHDTDDSLDHRDVLAVVSTLPQLGDDFADIALEDGSVWAASLLTNGSYEFVHMDNQGRTTTARWVRRTHPSGFMGSAPTDTTTPPPELKWTFSIIDPDTRRHPILGTLKSGTLDIFDTYVTMSASSSRFPPTRPVDVDATSLEDPLSPRGSIVEERVTMTVTDERKKLMVATAIWISLRQDDWPASANPKLSRASGQCRSASLRSVERVRAFSGPGTCPGATWVSGMVPVPGNATTLENRPPQPEATRHRRAMSTGAVFMLNRRRTSGLYDDDTVADELPHLMEEKKRTCRSRIRELTQRLFRRKNSDAQQELSFAKYALDD